MQETGVQSGVRVGAGVSGHLDGVAGAEFAIARCAEGLAGSRPDLVMLFISSHHVDAAKSIAHVVQKKLDPRVLVGCSAEAVLGGTVEMENSPGVALCGMALPGMQVKTFITDELPINREAAAADPAAMVSAAGFGPDHKATFLLCDPFSVPLNTLLPVMTRARNGASGLKSGEDGHRLGPMLGGLASGAPKPGGNALFMDDRILRSGGVGVSLSGDGLRVQAMVSQGCRPIGVPLVVTGVKAQMIQTLGGRPALRVLGEMLDGLSEAMREKLKRGLFIGRAINEYKQRFGRDDFLIRNVIGVDKAHEAIAVADLLRVGQTIQFHLRDAQTASEDLALLLDAQKLYDPPAGVVLFSCNGRGTRLFEKPHHDAQAISRAFAPALSAEQQAKGGTPIPAPTGSVPLAGFFCAGEIGPVGDQVFVHGQAACAAVIRKA